jgi:hypothetical protein
MATYFEPISNCQPPLPGSVPEVRAANPVNRCTAPVYGIVPHLIGRVLQVEITGEPEDDEHRVLYVSNDRVLPR